MKNVFLTTIITLLSFSLFSQNLPIPTSWKIKKISVSFGTDLDMLSGLDYSYMLKTGKGISESNFRDLNFAPENLYSSVCENPNIRISAAMDIPGLKNTELNLSLYGIFDRYDGVSYHTADYDYDFLNQDYQYLSINSLHHEIGLESSVSKRLRLKFLNFYGGLGTNMGYSFGGEMTINGDYQQTVNQNSSRTPSDIVGGTVYEDYHYATYEANDGFQQRIFGQLGIGIVFFKRLELGVDYRRGVGYRAIFGAPVKGVNLHALSTSIRWILK